jgi:hypothetical protein
MPVEDMFYDRVGHVMDLWPKWMIATRRRLPEETKNVLTKCLPSNKYNME